jgi:hypothetical protein
MALANTLYIPAAKIITAITNANPARVTTSVAHNYVNGGIVRIVIPPANTIESHGMQQIDQQFAPITVINPTNFYIAINTTAYEPFVVPSPQKQFAQSIAIAEVNESLLSAVSNSLNPQDVARGI